MMIPSTASPAIEMVVEPSREGKTLLKLRCSPWTAISRVKVPSPRIEIRRGHRRDDGCGVADERREQVLIGRVNGSCRTRDHIMAIMTGIVAMIFSL